MNKIVNVLSYDFGRNGGYLTLKFNDGWITKRSFKNVRVDKISKVCALSGEKIQVGHVACYVSIKKQGYPQYWIKQEAINKALSGEYDNIENTQTPLVGTLLSYIDSCQEARKDNSKEERRLRDGLLAVKFENSKIGKRMSAAHKLLELVSQDN